MPFKHLTRPCGARYAPNQLEEIQPSTLSTKVWNIKKLADKDGYLRLSTFATGTTVSAFGYLAFCEPDGTLTGDVYYINDVQGLTVDPNDLPSLYFRLRNLSSTSILNFNHWR